jgi:hypothetical protein
MRFTSRRTPQAHATTRVPTSRSWSSSILSCRTQDVTVIRGFGAQCARTPTLTTERNVDLLLPRPSNNWPQQHHLLLPRRPASGRPTHRPLAAGCTSTMINRPLARRPSKAVARQPHEVLINTLVRRRDRDAARTTMMTTRALLWGRARLSPAVIIITTLAVQPTSATETT